MTRELTLLDLLKLVRRWWWVLVFCPLLAAGVAYLVSSAMTPIYRATTTLLVEQSQVPGNVQYNDILAAERLTRTYSQLAQSRPVLEETIQRLSLPLTPDDLVKQVEVSAIQNTQLVEIAVRDPSPQRAAAIANTIAQVFIERTEEQQRLQTGSSRQELQKSIEDTKARIDELSARIAELETRPDASSATIQAELAGLRSQLNQAQTTYSSLLEADQRMALAEAQARSRVSIAVEAVPPERPVAPRVLLNTGLAGLLGLALGLGLVLVAGYLDDTVKTSEDVQQLTGRASLGIVPRYRTDNGLATLQQLQSLPSESYRALRTNLLFALAGHDAKTLVVTSPRPGDGKSTTLANLAVVLAQGGQKVIVVDADLRKPAQHRLFPGLGNRSGLTSLLLAGDDADVKPYLRSTPVANLRVLTSGPLPPNPPDLLSSPRFAEVLRQLCELADFVLIDTPPLTLSDPLVVASRTDAVLLVTLAGRTRSAELVRAVEALAPTPARLVGVVVNAVRMEHEGYYYYYEYYYQTPSGDGTASQSRGLKALLARGRSSSTSKSASSR